MGKLLSIDPVVLRKLRQLPRDDRIACLLALCELTESFGQPHRHSGLGVRKLGGKLFWAKDSHSELQLNDARNLIASVPAIDWPYIERWASELTVGTLLEEVRR